MVYNIQSSLATLPVNGQRVLMRADLNVPLDNAVIMDDFRLTSILPTLHALHKAGAHIILATHIGRPSNNDPALSTKPIAAWLEKHGYSTFFARDLTSARQHSTNPTTTITLLENLRFNPGEKNHDATFARDLAQLGDYYVNDAFGLLHEDDTSITDVPLLFAPEKRTIGLLIEHELEALNHLLTNPQRPFVVIAGGKKATTKIPLLKQLLDHVDTLLLCPALVAAFLQAEGKPYGSAKIEPDAFVAAHTLLEQAQKHGVDLVFPRDYQVAYQTRDGALSFKKADALTGDDVLIAVGPETLAVWQQIIAQAGTVFLNGVMGFSDKPETRTAAALLFKALQQSAAYTVVGGGDSVAAVRMLGLQNGIDHLAVGGGATLAYLSGKPLPGLAPFLPQ